MSKVYRSIRASQTPQNMSEYNVPFWGTIKILRAKSEMFVLAKSAGKKNKKKQEAIGNGCITALEELHCDAQHLVMFIDWQTLIAKDLLPNHVDFT